MFWEVYVKSNKAFENVKLTFIQKNKIPQSTFHFSWQCKKKVGIQVCGPELSQTSREEVAATAFHSSSPKFLETGNNWFNNHLGGFNWTLGRRQRSAFKSGDLPGRIIGKVWVQETRWSLDSLCRNRKACAEPWRQCQLQLPEDPEEAQDILKEGTPRLRQAQLPGRFKADLPWLPKE
jgi:hypothetical protein